MVITHRSILAALFVCATVAAVSSRFFYIGEHELPTARFADHTPGADQSVGDSCPPMSLPTLGAVACIALQPIAKPPGPKFQPTPGSPWKPASTADCQSIIVACNKDRLASGLYPIDPTSGFFEHYSCNSYSCELPPNPPIGDLATLCDSTDDEIRASSQAGLQGTYPLLAACASEAASEFQRLPYPPFWASNGPSSEAFFGKDSDMWELNSAGYLRGLTCLSKKSCASMSSVYFATPGRTPFINVFQAQQQGTTTLYTRCFAKHLKSKATSPIESQVILTVNCPKWDSKVEPPASRYCNGWDALLGYEWPSSGPAKPDVSTMSPTEVVIRILLSSIYYLNKEDPNNAQIAGYTGQAAALMNFGYDGYYCPACTPPGAKKPLCSDPATCQGQNKTECPDSCFNIWFDGIKADANHFSTVDGSKDYSPFGGFAAVSQEILGTILQYAPYGGGGIVSPPAGSNTDKRIGLQPLYASWEETNPTDQQACGASGSPPFQEAPTLADPLAQKNDYTSTFFRCALPHLRSTPAINFTSSYKLSVTAVDKCTDGYDMGNYISTWSKEFMCDTPKGNCRDLNTLIKQVAGFRPAQLDKLILQFSVEQDVNRIQDLCMNQLFNSNFDGGLCGEPNGLGILSRSQTVQWFWAVKKLLDAALAGAEPICTYTGFYQTELLPLHFLTDANYSTWWRWDSHASNGGVAGYQGHYNNGFFDAAALQSRGLAGYYDHFKTALPTSAADLGSAPNFAHMSQCGTPFKYRAGAGDACTCTVDYETGTFGKVVNTQPGDCSSTYGTVSKPHGSAC